MQLAIQQLPEKQKVVFTLRYYDEMPYEEMSRVLDTSEGALKAWISVMVDLAELTEADPPTQIPNGETATND